MAPNLPILPTYPPPSATHQLLADTGGCRPLKRTALLRRRDIRAEIVILPFSRPLPPRSAVGNLSKRPHACLQHADSHDPNGFSA